MKALVWMLAAAFLVTAVPAPVAAQPRAVTVKIIGTVDEAPSEGRARAMWRLNVSGKTIDLHVTKLELLAGGPTPADIFRHLRVNRGVITVSGEPAGLKTVTDATKGQTLTIQGTMRWAETPAILLVSTASAK